MKNCSATFPTEQFAGGPGTFGQALWLEGYQQEVTQGKEVAAIGDGANWIQYVWKVA